MGVSYKCKYISNQLVAWQPKMCVWHNCKKRGRRRDDDDDDEGRVGVWVGDGVYDVGWSVVAMCGLSSLLSSIFIIFLIGYAPGSFLLVGELSPSNITSLKSSPLTSSKQIVLLKSAW